MSRHRDVRCMNYSDDYEGYDDVYGHSVEDEFCVSPGAEQFMFDRNKQADISSFLTDSNIAEGNDEELAEQSASFKSPALSELESAKLMSCIETIRNVVGDTVPESDLKRKIIELDYNSEAVLDNILSNASANKSKEQLTKTPLDFPLGNKPTPKATLQAANPTIKVVPAAAHSVIKGFDLTGAENSEVVNSRIESPRSQTPSSERNSPDVRRRADSSYKGKRSGFSKSNTPRCQSPTSGTASPEPESRTKTADEKVDAFSIYKNKRGDSKEQLHLVVVGHVDAGKSTLLGRLLCDLGQVSSKLIHKYQQESKKIGKQSFAYAWVLDETGEERERGITMDVGHSKFETSTKSITLLDAPGHKDFIPNMITGATQADVALLVVDATRGEFETGFDSGGQTREHAILLRSLGISQLAVVVNKLDTVEWSKERFNEIVNKMSIFLKQVGFRDAVTFVPCSGLSGENIVSKPKEVLANWYNGPTLVDVIDNFKCPERPIDKPLRFSVNDIFKGTGSGFCVSGHVETGLVSVGNKILILPRNEVAHVKGIQIDDSPVANAFAGDQAALLLAGVDHQNIGIGDILCSLQNPVPVTTCFQAHIVIFNIKHPITKGIPIVIHQQSLIEPAVITKLIAQLHRSTGDEVKKKPRCLPKNSSAIVEITTQKAICMELYRDVKELGRVMLRVEGTTIAAGLVTKIK